MQFSRPNHFREPHRLKNFERNGAGPPTHDLTRSLLQLVLLGTLRSSDPSLNSPATVALTDPPPSIYPRLPF